MSVLFKVMRNRGLSIWLIFTYMVRLFTLILMVLPVFRESASGRSYANFKFFRLHVRENHSFLLPELNSMILFLYFQYLFMCFILYLLICSVHLQFLRKNALLRHICALFIIHYFYVLKLGSVGFSAINIY